MTRRILPALVAFLLAGAAIAGFAYTRFATPEPVVDPVAELEYECTTCDARQASKKRLREHLQSLPD